MRLRKTSFVIRLAALLACLSAPAMAAPSPGQCPSASATSRIHAERRVSIEGRAIAYRISFARTTVGDGKTTPSAEIFSTDYIASDQQGASRPIIFAYSGGPNFASTSVQFGGLGPMRYPFAGSGELVDNPDSPMGLADMVFIDPVGTGFSHAVAPAKDDDFWGFEQDADSIAAFVTAWLKDHHRERAPVFLLGESYGGIRSIKVAHRLLTQTDPVDVRGEILISGAVDFVAGAPQPGHDENWVLQFPTMAAVAWVQGKVDHQGRDFHSFLRSAETFAAGDYANALFQGARLSPEERQRIIERMNSFIGLDPRLIDAANLRVSSFSTELLKSEQKTVSYMDGRNAVPAGQHDPMWGQFSSMFSAQKKLMSTELGVACVDQYILRAKNKSWDWRFTYGSPDLLDVYASGTGILSRDLDAAKHLHVFMIGGYYDLNVPYFETEYIAAHLGAQDRTTVKVYEGGHGTYLDTSARIKIGKDLSEFVRRSLVD